LMAAAHRPQVGAIVSRGGRPDLAGLALGKVKAPTLLIVGEKDDVVLSLHRKILSQLHCPHELVVVPGATHLLRSPAAWKRCGTGGGLVSPVSGAGFRGWFAKGLRK